MPADLAEAFPASRVATAPPFPVVVGLVDPAAAAEAVPVPVDDVGNVAGNVVLDTALVDNALVTGVVWEDLLVDFATNPLEYC